MATIRRDVRVSQPAETVWQVVGKPGILHHWFPGLDDCSMDEDRIPPVRTIVMDSGIRMEEEILVNDPIQHRLQYRITSPVFSHHLGTVDVIEIDAQSCMIVYSTDAVPDPMALVVGGATGGAAEELAAQFAAGAGPALEAAGVVLNAVELDRGASA